MIDKLKALCERKNLSFRQVELDLGWGNGTLKKSDKEKISYSRMAQLVNYFGEDGKELLDVEFRKKIEPADIPIDRFEKIRDGIIARLALSDQEDPAREEAEQVAKAYAQAPESIKDAICKLLDIKRALESSKEKEA